LGRGGLGKPIFLESEKADEKVRLRGLLSSIVVPRRLEDVLVDAKEVVLTPVAKEVTIDWIFVGVNVTDGADAAGTTD